MANKLIKAITPALPPITPRLIGPPHPAYCVDQTVTIPLYELRFVAYGIPPGVVLVLQPFLAGTRTTIVHTCYPPSSGVFIDGPPTPSTPANFNIGWNASAVSQVSMVADVQYTFDMPQSVAGVVTGLNSTNTGSQYIEIDHGFYFSGGHFAVIERGVEKTTYTTYADGDSFAVVRINGQVRYFFNYVEVYASDLPSTEPVFVDASLYAGGDRILNAALSDTIDPDFGATELSISGAVGPVGGYWADSNGLNISGQVSPVGGTWEAPNELSISHSITIGGSFYGSSDPIGEPAPGEHYFVIHGEVGGVGGSFESGFFQPEFLVAQGEVSPVGSFFTALAGTTLSISHGVQVGGWWDNTGGLQIHGSISPVEGLWFDLPANVGYGRGELAALEGTAFGQVDQVVDPDGNPVSYGGHGQFAALTGRGYGGAMGRGEFAALTGNATGILTLVGEGRGDLAALEGTATGVLSWTGVGRGTFAALTGTGYGGGVGQGTFAALEQSDGLILVGTVGAGRGVFAALEGTATGVIWLAGAGRGEFAALEQVAAGIGRGTFAALEGNASGLIVVTATYEGYSFTLAGDAVLPSRLTAFPFTRILRWKGRYIGLTATGLYVLGGDTFDGDPILADVITAEDDFGIPNAKRPRSVWIPGRGGNDLAVSIIGSEVDPEESGTVDEGSGVRNRRAVFGKGVRARYLGFRVRNLEGEDFAIDALAPEFDTLRRYS